MLGKAKSTESASIPEFGESLSPRCGRSAGQDVVLVAANAEAVAQLQLLASSHVVDLEAITNVIRKDAGLTIQVLQLSARRFGKHADGMSTLTELIIQLGLEQLRAIATQVTLTLPHERRH
jgi:HD-like signal output (HDOD) protein